MESRILLTVEQAADMLSISRAHLYQILGRGEIPSVFIGRTRRIRTDAVQRFIDERTVPAAALGS